MIPQDLLAATDSRAPGILVYGAAGLKKTHGMASLPPPIEAHDFEGGTASIAPWIRRRRNSDETRWTEYTDEQRQTFLDLLNEQTRRSVPFKPAPLVDVIHYDNSQARAWADFTVNIGNFDYKYYNSIAVDSLQEFSGGAQSFSKGAGNEMALMNEVTHAWVKAQERAQIALRKLRNYRDVGCVVYLTGSEDISKDYVKNPMEKGAQGQEPYSVRGTVNLPGKLAEAVAHIPDLLCHARLLNGALVWCTAPEPLPGGGAWWDGKDRFGRLDTFVSPNFRQIFVQLYGEATRDAIYTLWKK